MILRNGIPYNPKIDYLVCKCILNEYQDQADENHLRDCFFNKASCQSEEELNLCMIRNFFYQNDILIISSEQLKPFFSFMKWDYEFNGVVGNTLEEQIFHLAQELKDRESIFRFLFVVCFAKDRNELIIPRTRGIRKILQSSSIEEVSNCISYLVRKTNHYNEKHDHSIHPFILPILEILGNEFLKQTGFLGLGVYGSFALGTTNEYSDLDLMVVVHKPYDKRIIRRITNEFFKRFIPIPIDIKVTSIEDMDSELTIGMKKTVKGIAGGKLWKKFIS